VNATEWQIKYRPSTLCSIAKVRHKVAHDYSYISLQVKALTLTFTMVALCYGNPLLWRTNMVSQYLMCTAQAVCFTVLSDQCDAHTEHHHNTISPNSPAIYGPSRLSKCAQYYGSICCCTLHYVQPTHTTVQV